RRVSPLLAQAIGLVRDLAVDETNDRVRAAGVVSTLCSIFRPFRNHQDVVLNTARALARLSLHQPTRGLITSEPGHVRDLLAALLEQDSSRATCSTAAVAPVEHRQHWDNQGKRVATCVRIAFALGNLTSASDENRRLIGLRFGGAESLPAFLHTFSRAYLMAWECMCSVETHHAASMDGITETEEMLVKAVRLLANISIRRDVGQRVCRHPGLVALEPLLGNGVGPAEAATIPGEELLLNAVCLITNLSYYGPTAANCTAASPVRRAPPSISSTRTPAVVSRVVGVLCGHLVKVLLHPNAEAVTEAARAFGNFLR
ncbi:unnamed protein product, partial [Ectocarpus sp. 12 AP-2014]